MLFDTTFFIDLEHEIHARRPGPAAVFLAAQRGRAKRVATVTLGEFAAGGASGPAFRRFCRGFLPVPLGREDAIFAGQLQARLSFELGENDLGIAGLALRHGFALVTRDRAFSRVPGLRVVAYGVCGHDVRRACPRRGGCWTRRSSRMTASTTTPSLGFGIIGVGMIADYHAQAIAAATGARLVGIATRSAENARAFAAKHGVPFATTSVAELVARPDIAVVCITTPSGAHLEPALAAVRAGKHLVVEKPIEITTERADELLRAAEVAGVKISPIFQARFGGGARALKAAIEAGRFGRIVLASAYVKWHRSREYYTGWKGTLALDGGGAAMNQGIHGIDLLQWLAGMPDEVYARKTRRVYEHIEAEDTLSATLHYPDGALGSIEATTAAWPGWSRRIEICGENGSACLKDDHLEEWKFREALPHDEAIRAAGLDPAMASGAGAPNAISYEGHLRQIQDLVDSLRDNRPVAIDGHEARKAVALIRALYASAACGAPVKL